MNFWFYHFECQVYYYVFFFFFKCCADVENCGSFKSFGFIYIYIDDKIYLEVTLLLC